MNERQRFLKTMRFEPVDRQPYHMVGPWVDTLARWQNEGLPRGMTVAEFLGYPRFTTLYAGPEAGVFPRFKEEVIAEDETFIVQRDRNGITNRRHKNSSAMPEYIDFPIKNARDLERFIHERFSLDDLDARFPADWDERIAGAADPERETVTFVDGGCCYGHLRRLAGVETCSLLFYEAPALVKRYIDHVHRIAMHGMERVFAHTSVDYIGFGEDIAFKTSTLISPDMFREFLFPAYKEAIDLARSHGVDIVWYDSDGNLNPFMELYAAAGIDGFAPCEVAADMDPADLRARYGNRLRLMGGMDKREIARGPDAIRAEVLRKSHLIRAGGYIPTVDHSISSDISLENYVYFRKLLDDVYAGRSRERS